MRTISFALIASILVNTAFAVVGRGSFTHGIGVIALVAYIGLPALVFGIGAFAVGFHLPGAKTLSRYALAFAFLMWSTLISLPVGSILLEHDIEAAKGYCESLIPELEAYRTTHGTFPANIAMVADKPTLPRLLSKSSYYWSDGAKFCFSFGNPAGMMNGFVYDSDSNRWSEWD